MRHHTYPPTIMMHSDWHVTPGTFSAARRSPPPRSALTHSMQVMSNTLRYLTRHPLVVLTIIIAGALLAGTIGAAQDAARLDAQIGQARANNTHISQQIAQTNALIVQLSQDNAIIAAALKLGYVMPTGNAP